MKELAVRMSTRSPGLYEVYYEGGGELPAELQGSAWTHKHIAEMAIDHYLTYTKRGAKGGSTGSKPRTE